MSNYAVEYIVPFGQIVKELTLEAQSFIEFLVDF